jgi:hypothetical protein
MMSHEQMMNNGSYRSGYRGLHYFGGGVICDAAAAAARAAFEVCDGKSTSWKSWVHPSGRLVRLAQSMMMNFLDEHPNASSEQLYRYISHFPCDGDRIPFSSGNIWHVDPTPWEALPPAVRAAFEAYRHVYLELWLIARSHHEVVARAIPQRPRPQLVQSDRSKVVPLPSAGTMPDSDGAA